MDYAIKNLLPGTHTKRLCWSAPTFKMPGQILLFLLLVTFNQSFSQSGDLSQIRNGSGDTIKTGSGGWDTCGKCWVNGNAGASNAHYTEGMSIAYRSLITGLTPGHYYEYEIGFDTYHSAMAIDYLTQYQRLEPHGPFKHKAEVVQPLVFLNGSTEYVMHTTSKDTLSFPAPSASGITTGAFNKDGTPRDISQQARTSFLALPDSQKVMTIFNGDLINICYIQENTIVIGGADAESRMRVRFMAQSDSVLLAWGGHIASRLDWGYFKTNNGTLKPLSAAGISGSPYHMRQKAFYEVDATKVAGVCDPNTFVTAFSGFGNQDRSLSAAAVIPPPDCPSVQSLSHCYQDSSFTFSIISPVAGVTYTWAIGNNNIGAVFSGSNVGTSVTVIAHPGADTAGVDDGGSFSLNINVSQNFVDQTCNGVATGTLVDVDVAASAYSSAIDLAVKDTTHLSSTVSGGGTAPYSFQWKALEPGSTFGSATSQNTLVTVPHEAGTYTYRVIATDANGCKDSATVQIVVSAGTPACGISGPTTICPGTTNTYKYDTNNDQTADPLPTNFTAVWKLVSNTNNAATSGSTTGNSVSVVAGSSCNTSYIVRIVLTSTSGLIKDSCQLAVNVNVTSLPTITCPGDANIECGSAIPNPPNPSTQQAALQTFFTNAGGSFTGQCTPVLSFSDVPSNQNCFTFIKRTWTVTDGCGNTASCTQTIKVVDRTAPSVTCTSSQSVPCGQSIAVPTNSDNCGGTVTVFFKDVPFGAAANRQPLTRTWTFIDPSGNSTTCVQSITFQACSTFVSKTPVDQLVNTTTQQSSKPKVSQAITELQVQAYPNPFNSAVNFVLVSPVSGKANLEIYDMLGRKLAIVYQGNLQAGVQKTISYRVPTPYKVPIVYKLSVGSKSSRGKLLPDKVTRQ